MISTTKRTEVRTLLAAGESKVGASRRTGVSLRSVSRIAGETEPYGSDDLERRRRRIGRPSRIPPFHGLAFRLLAENPHVTTAAILRSLQLAGYAGGKTAVYGFVATARRRREKGAEPLELRRGSLSGDTSFERRAIDGVLAPLSCTPAPAVQPRPHGAPPSTFSVLAPG